MIDLTLPDMSCGHCVRTVTETVQALDAEARVTADLAKRSVAIDTKADDQAVRTALTEAGYPPAGT